MYQTFLCLTIFVITCLTPQVDNAGCNDHEHKNIFYCYNSDVSSNTSDYLCNEYSFLKNTNISHKVLNPTAGTVELTFDLGRNCPHNYTILIKCGDNCENVTENNHSTVLYQKQSTHSLQKCGQIIQVQLEYIFSSCYQITLKLDHKEDKVFKKIFIETKFVKELFDANTTNIKFEWKNKQKPVNVFTYVNNKIYKEVLDICMELMELKKPGLELIWTASCKLGENNRICNTTLLNGDGHHPVDCTIFQSTIILMTCRVQNMTEGLYAITSMILNEPVRCLSSNNFVWGYPNCKISRTGTITDINTGSIQEKSDKFIILYLFLFLTLIFTVTVISLFFYYQCKRRIRNNQQDNNLLLNPPDILLLYARDCIPFMVAMTTLRDVLENTKVCSKVYDIHDEERREEILTNKINWVSNILRNKNVKILIVLSTCGTRQIHRQTSAIDFYKEPETHEDLFLHTIQILRNESVYSNRKIYVCTFDFTQNERNVLTNLKKVKQYLLPNQIKKLIKDLFKTNQYINVDEFNDRCRDFNVYIKNDPHYLKNIIRACSLNMTQL